MAILTEVIGYLGGALISIAFLPQTYKLFKTKDTKSLSLVCYLIYHLGLTLFIIYGSFEQLWPIVGANAFGWIVNVCLLSLICYNRYGTKKKNTKK